VRLQLAQPVADVDRMGGVEVLQLAEDEAKGLPILLRVQGLGDQGSFSCRRQMAPTLADRGGAGLPHTHPLARSLDGTAAPPDPGGR
jgi:hypothetical protein